MKVLTFGFWKQGLIPANKSNIGKQMAEEIKTKLLTPEALATEICTFVQDKLNDKSILERFKNELQSIIAKNKESIVFFVVPRIQKTIISMISTSISTENLKEFGAML